MTGSNIDRYEADLKRLIDETAILLISMQRSVAPDDVDRQLRAKFGDKADGFIKSLPNFSTGYQAWYSEALAVIRQILPDRLADFRLHYERPKGVRKEILQSNYVIEDFIQGTTVTLRERVIASPASAIPRFEAQVSILKACKARFKSSLFDIRQLVQADLFDGELDAARALLKNGFTRAAGAMSGVVLEHHLQQVMENHAVTIAKKNPTLGDLSQALKDASVIDTPDWRRLLHLSDLRNKCDHKKAADPTKEEVDDLISGVERTIKTLF